MNKDSDDDVPEQELREVQQDMDCFRLIRMTPRAKEALYEGLLVIYPKSKKIIKKAMANDPDLAESGTDETNISI